MSIPYKLALPKAQEVRFLREWEVPQQEMGYDELCYDPCTMRYFTKSQELENQKLRRELEQKEVEKIQGIDNLIGYFYKNR